MLYNQKALYNLLYNIYYNRLDYVKMFYRYK